MHFNLLHGNKWQNMNVALCERLECIAEHVIFISTQKHSYGKS